MVVNPEEAHIHCVGSTLLNGIFYDAFRTLIFYVDKFGGRVVAKLYQYELQRFCVSGH